MKDKPFTLIVRETEEKIVEVLNNSKLPAYTMMTLLKGLYEQISIMDNQEIENYKTQLQKEEKEK